MVEPVFRARQVPQSVGLEESSNSDAGSAGTHATSQSPAIELSKNAHFCLSRLPANPPLLSKTSTFSNAYADGRSQFALAVDDCSVVAWPYSSTDSSPVSVLFPLSSNPLTPLAILTLPCSPASSAPGLLTVDSLLGKVTFYDSISHAPALGLINNRLLETCVPLNMEKGEYITMAENVEPAGVAVATSWKRCVLISLRDFQNIPLLQCIELRGTSSNSGFFHRILFGGHSDIPEIGDEIVSIKTASITGRGVSQDLVIMDSAGQFDYVTYHLTSATGNPHVEHRKSFLHSLKYLLEACFDTFDSPDITFLDLWPLPNATTKYAALVHAGKSGFRGQLVIATLHIDQTGVLVHGQHRLAKYEETQLLSLANKPKLFLPGPGTAAFIAFDNCVLVSDIDTSYILEKSTVAPYKPRWEDVVRLRPLVDIIGYGYETELLDRNPALIILTKGSGVMRLEKFPAHAASSVSSTLPYTLPLEMLKSRIELGVFYADSQELELDINTHSDDNDLKTAVLQIRSEISDLTSPYLNGKFPLISDSLAARVHLLGKLYQYCERNFPTLFKAELAYPIAESWEQLGVCRQLWRTIDDPINSDTLKPILQSVIYDVADLDGDLAIVFRDFFDDYTHMAGKVLVEFVRQSLSSNVNVEVIADSITDCIYEGIYNKLSQHAGLHEIGVREWLPLPQLLLLADETFINVYENPDTSILAESRKDQLIRMVKCLCFLSRDALKSWEYTATPESRDEHVQWQRQRSIRWMDSLILQCLQDISKEIAEFTRDFFALSHILETCRARIESDSLQSMEEDNEEHGDLMNEYTRYFESYGYAFAEQLYDYYTLRGLVQPLLLDFTNYKQYLNRYLAENSDQTAKFAWIRYVLDSQYACAAHSLVRAGHDTHSAATLELNFALAKIAALAAGRSPQTEEALLESEHVLTELRAQRALYDSIRTAVGVLEAMLFEKYLDTIVNKTIDSDMAESLLRPGFDTFVHQNVLDFTSLVNFLTLVNPSISHRAYADALKLSANLVSEYEANYWAKIIWLRIIVFSDDWSDQDLAIMSDEQKRATIRALLLFVTLEQTGVECPAFLALQSLITNTQEFEKEATDKEINSSIRDSNSRLLKSFLLLLEKHDLESWVNTLAYELRHSGPPFNHTTLMITD